MFYGEFCKIFKNTFLHGTAELVVSDDFHELINFFFVICVNWFAVNLIKPIADYIRATESLFFFLVSCWKIWNHINKRHLQKRKLIHFNPPLVFWCFQGVSKQTSGMKWVKGYSQGNKKFNEKSNTHEKCEYRNFQSWCSKTSISWGY